MGEGTGEGDVCPHSDTPATAAPAHVPSCDPLTRRLSSPRARDALEEAREKTRKARTTTAGDAGPWGEPCAQQSLSSHWKALTSGHRALLGAHCRSLRAAGTEGVAPAALVLVALPRTVHLLCKPSLPAPRLTALQPAGWPCILSAPYQGGLCVAGVLGFSDARGSHCTTQQQDLAQPEVLDVYGVQVWFLGSLRGGTSVDETSGHLPWGSVPRVCHVSCSGWVTPRGDGLATLADTSCHFRVIPKPLVLRGLVLQLLSCFCSTVPSGGGPEGLAFCARLCHEFISFTGKCPHPRGSTH